MNLETGEYILKTTVIYKETFFQLKLFGIIFIVI